MTPAASETGHARLSVIVPAYNEQDRIGAALDELLDWLATREPAELIVADDGSRDRTRDVVATRLCAPPPGIAARCMHLPHRGKGAALRAGVANATGELLLLTDADLSAPLTEFERLVPRIDAGADFAIASRDAVGARLDPPQPWPRRALADAFRAVRRRLLTPKLLDTQCGFKLMRREAAERVFGLCREDGWLIDVEALAIADRLGYRIDEVGVTWRDRPGGHVRPLREAPASLLGLIRIRRRLLRFEPPPAPTDM